MEEEKAVLTRQGEVIVIQSQAKECQQPVEA